MNPLELSYEDVCLLMRQASLSRTLDEMASLDPAMTMQIVVNNLSDALGLPVRANPKLMKTEWTVGQITAALRRDLAKLDQELRSRGLVEYDFTDIGPVG